MANEFIIKNGFHSKGNSQVTGSLDVTEGITGSFSGDGSGITGTVTSASYAITASHALNAGVTPTLQQVTDEGASTSNDITISGDLTASADISLPTLNASINMINGSILSRTGGSYPGIQLNSGATNNTIWFLAGNNNSVGGGVTASFAEKGFINNVGVIRAQGNSSLLLQGGPTPNDVNDGVKIETADASNVYQPRFQIESDTATVDAYFHNINGLGINDTTPTAMLDVNGNINTTSDITASGDISAATFTGDGSGITGVISASYAITASHALAAESVEYSNVNNKPTLVSGSAQISYTGITDIPAGILSSSAQISSLVASK